MDALAWLRDSDLIAPVRRLLGGDAVTIDAWSTEPIAGGAGEALGVWRVTGEATVDGSPMPFTVILKGWLVPPDATERDAWNWPLRELRAYTSGMLDDLPGGIASPGCLDEVLTKPGEAWAWLTPMSTGALDRWTLDHFALVAHRIGQFNGAYLASKPQPEADWVSRRWTRKWTEAARESIEQFDRYVAHPRVARAFPPAERRAIERLFAARYRWFDAIDALPHTFCHLDVFPRNVFLHRRDDGDHTVSLIDWGYAGIAAVGEEIAPLVSASVTFGEAEGIPIDTLDETVFAAYIEGLQDAGWHGDERLVRMGYAGSLAMRYLLGPLRVFLPLLVSDHADIVIERVFHITLDVLRDRGQLHNAWAWGIADEFRQYLATMPPRHSAAA